MGFEPIASAWKAENLPLIYTRYSIARQEMNHEATSASFASRCNGGHVSFLC